MIHKLPPFCRLHLVVEIFWTLNLINQPNLLGQQIRKLHYWTLGISVINNTMFPPSLFIRDLWKVPNILVKYLRGPNVFKEYLNKPEATQKEFDGDWFKTGDTSKVSIYRVAIFRILLKTIYLCMQLCPLEASRGILGLNMLKF